MIQQEKELFREIRELTSKIQRNHPELIKYLDEMPNTIPNHLDDKGEMSHLRSYKNSLDKLLENYEKGH